MPEEKPVFTHDCSKCVFLGRHIIKHGAWQGGYDLYVCKKNPHVTIFIARYSSHKPGMYSCVEQQDLDSTHPAVEALRRAKAKGLA